MKAPDGQEFGPERAGPVRRMARDLLAALARFCGWAGRGLARLLLAALRASGRVAIAMLRAVWKFIATVWRLAGALDAALWRGVKLFVRGALRILAAAARLASAALGDFVRWLPSRTGKAYTAFSGVILILAALWMIDELRVPANAVALRDDPLRPPVDLQDPIVARVEGRYVHLSEVASAAAAAGAINAGETLTATSAFQRGLVESYVEQRLLARAAANDGLHRAPQVASQLAAARDRVLAAAYLEEKLAETVTDEAVARLYRRQADIASLGEEVRARHILLHSGEEAESVLAALRKGAAFEELAGALSKDKSTADKGGDLGWFSKGQLDPAVATAAFATPVGSYAPPFQTADGWHVLQVLDRRQGPAVPFASVKETIRQFLAGRTIDATLAKLRTEKDVVYYRDEAQSPPQPTSAVLLREGSDAGGI